MLEAGSAPAAADADPASNQPLAASFDPGLRSASTVEYATHGAQIVAPRITTPDGRDVNVLVRGERYVVRYTVRFAQSARRVRFGMMIKTTSGVELGGGTCPDAGFLDGEFAAGSSVTVTFQFTCNLFAGMYFLNTGLMGEVQGNDTYLHRLVDAVAFRVASDASRKQSGYVDFSIDAALVDGEVIAAG
jgi:lipopolysaccharide transport system ATP-binding protein